MSLENKEKILESLPSELKEQIEDSKDKELNRKLKRKKLESIEYSPGDSHSKRIIVPKRTARFLNPFSFLAYLINLFLRILGITNNWIVLCVNILGFYLLVTMVCLGVNSFRPDIVIPGYDVITFPYFFAVERLSEILANLDLSDKSGK